MIQAMAEPGAPAASGAAFDAAARDYDARFTDTPLGRALRRRVWDEIASYFRPGGRALELNCGTGEDALWLARRGISVLATDASTEMLAMTRSKVRRAGLDDRVATAALALEDLPSAGPSGPFDAVLSNFGGLNCLFAYRPLAEALSGRVRLGGILALVVMGPLCPWEIAWYGAHLQVTTAVRRLRPGGVTAQIDDAGAVRVHYPSPRRLIREFGPWFRPVDVVGIGVALPPSYLGGLVERRPGLLDRLARADRRLSRLPGRWLHDHYLLLLERV